MNLFKFVPVVLVVVMCIGCASFITPNSNFTPYNEGSYSPKSPSVKIDIYSTPPKKDYVEIGVISFEYSSEDLNMTETLKEARKHGADAIIILKKNHLRKEGILGGLNYGIEALAIKYK